MKHVQIGGTSFCGSTVMSLILGTAEGAANVGESHWLVPFDTQYSCHYCGPACQIWTRDFRKRLEADERNWYPRLAERLRSDILISADKSHTHINRLDPDHDHTALILFKRPGNFWHSVNKRRWRSDSLEQSLTRWSWLYQDFLDAAYAPEGGKYFMSVETFMADPDRAIPVLFDTLGLSGTPEQALRYWETVQHYVGGNFNAYDKLTRRGEEALQLGQVESDENATAQVEALADHPAHAMIEEMRARCLLGG